MIGNCLDHGASQVDYAALLKRFEPQQHGERIRISIDGIELTVLDSFALSYVLEKLPLTSHESTRLNARLKLGDDDIELGQQSASESSLKSLGVTDGTLLYLSGATLKPDPLELSPPAIPLAPTKDDFLTIPRGTNFCCSKFCCSRRVRLTGSQVLDV